MSSMGQPHLESVSADHYRDAMFALASSGVPFLVGGAYAQACYFGIERRTKDFDVFVRPRDVERALESLARCGFQTELTFPHWLGKAYAGADYVDVIFSSGNGVAVVDEQWFEHARDAVVLGLPVRLCPPEEMIWSKTFVMERERYDGADVMHLLRAVGHRLDWERLVARFEPHPELLLSVLTLFAFVYPGSRALIPSRVLDTLIGRFRAGSASRGTNPLLCRGTLVSRSQYLEDVERLGHIDARLAPHGGMSEAQIAHWTAAGLLED